MSGPPSVPNGFVVSVRRSVRNALVRLEPDRLSHEVGDEVSLIELVDLRVGGAITTASHYAANGIKDGHASRVLTVLNIKPLIEVGHKVLAGRVGRDRLVDCETA